MSMGEIRKMVVDKAHQYNVMPFGRLAIAYARRFIDRTQRFNKGIVSNELVDCYLAARFEGVVDLIRINDY